MKAGEPNKLKKALYLSASVLLGILLSFIAHAFIEINYLRQALGANQTVNFYGGCALPPWFRFGLLTLGITGGIFLGRRWWRKIYIERSWPKK